MSTEKEKKLLLEEPGGSSQQKFLKDKKNYVCLKVEREGLERTRMKLL